MSTRDGRQESCSFTGMRTSSCPILPEPISLGDHVTAYRSTLSPSLLFGPVPESISQDSSPLRAFQEAMSHSDKLFGPACPALLQQLEELNYGDCSDGKVETSLTDLCLWSLQSEFDLKAMAPASRTAAAAHLLFNRLLPNDSLGRSLDALSPDQPLAVWREGWTKWLADCDLWVLEHPLSLERLDAANALAQAWSAHQDASFDEWQGLVATARWRMLLCYLRPHQSLSTHPRDGASSLARWLQYRLEGLQLIWPRVEEAKGEELSAARNIFERFAKFCIELDEPIRSLLSDHIGEQLLSLIDQGRDENIGGSPLWKQLSEGLESCLKPASVERQPGDLDSSTTRKPSPRSTVSQNFGQLRRPQIERFLRYPGWSGTAGDPGSTPSQRSARSKDRELVSLGAGKWAAALFWPAFQPTEVLRDLNLCVDWESRLHQKIAQVSLEDLQDGIVEGDDQLSELLRSLCSAKPDHLRAQEHLIQGLCLQACCEESGRPSQAILAFLKEEGSSQTISVIGRARELSSLEPLQVMATWQKEIHDWLHTGRLERSPASTQRLWDAFVQSGSSFSGWTWPSVYMLKMGAAALSCCEEEFDTVFAILESTRAQQEEDSFQGNLQKLWGCDLRHRARHQRQAQDLRSMLLRTLDTPMWRRGWESLQRALH
jgi:hypothetical protein